MTGMLRHATSVCRMSDVEAEWRIEAAQARLPELREAPRRLAS